MARPPRTRLALRWLAPDPERQSTALGSAMLLGRDETCDVVLEGREVSREHARIEGGAQPVIRDLESMNGIYLNAVQERECPLRQADLLRIGDWLALVVAERLDAPPDEPWFREIVPGAFGGPELCEALDSARRAADGELTVVLEGETGTGKEVIARALHQLSGRRGSYRAINCATLPESLAEAELFGYRKGAFTNADQASPGHLRAAEGGTLLLDEVSDLPLAVQPKLLRALQEREVVPIGETRAVPIDVRLIAASQQPLHELVAEGRFRADLFARLDGVSVRLPPLRERIGDVPLLFRHVAGARNAARPVDVRLIERLCLYDWPGNVRELIQLVERLRTLHADAPSWRSEHLPRRFERVRWRAGKPVPMPRSPTPEAERPVSKPPRRRRSLTARDERDLAQLLDALRAAAGNITRASQTVGMTRQRAYRLLEAGSDVDIAELRRGKE
jgi:transcriptional regulator with GAF, ATPase, and Fis domain